MKDKNKVVARMTIIKTGDRRVIVEVWNNATFTDFYHFFIQFGNRRSTKQATRTVNRNEGLVSLNAFMQQPGLDKVARQAERWSRDIVEIKTRIIRKRAYRQLLEAAPDELGMVKSHAQPVKPLSAMILPAFDRNVFDKAKAGAS